MATLLSNSIWPQPNRLIGEGAGMLLIPRGPSVKSSHFSSTRLTTMPNESVLMAK